MLMASNSVNFTIVSWNVRGLGDADKCKLVRDSLLTARVDIACLQESKLRTITSSKSRSFLPPHLTDFHCAEAVGSRGGIITAWNARAFTASSYIARRHTLTFFSPPLPRTLFSRLLMFRHLLTIGTPVRSLMISARSPQLVTGFLWATLT